MIKLDIIIPVYNEGENIVRLLKDLENEITYDFRVLICYDSENDNTLEYLRNKNVIKKEILLIKNPKQGPNSAIIEGINSSRSEIILVYMADDFENIKIVNKMIKLIESGNDLVIPSRFIAGGKMLNAKKMKKAVTVTGSYLMYYLAGIPFKDCTNAFKMFSKNLKDKIKLKSTTGFTYAMELTTKSYLFNFKIVEIPSIWIDETGRKSNFKVLKWLRFYIYWMLYALLKNFFKRFK
mgnify:FL=1